VEKVGTRIRVERKKRGLTLEALAREVGVSLITIQRIETGKTSPSVALLSDIAQCLSKSVFSFLSENEKPYTLLNRKKQSTSTNKGLKIRVIAPRRMVTDKISVTYGELKKGKSIALHSNPGIEFAYVIAGKCELRLGENRIPLERGDSISYNARIEHEVIAIEDHKFIAIYVRDVD
jgi:transcriptional regulator with XRE-family HTH domain